MKRNHRLTQCPSRSTMKNYGSLLQTRPLLRRLRGSQCLSQAAAAATPAVKTLKSPHKR